MDSSNKKAIFINICKQCLDIFRDREGFTGGKALKNLSYFITLKLLEKQFDESIDIDNFKYDIDENIQNIEEFKTSLLKNVRFSNLSSVKADDITTVMVDVWDNILSQHPSTRNIFVPGKFFDAEHQSTYKSIVDKLNTFDLDDDDDFDVLGGAYEEVIKHIMVGKTLGQYFTQSIVKNLMVKLIKPKVFADGTIETCVDPTMGTAGFLTTYLKYIKKRAIKDNIELDWDFIKTNGVYGKEIETDTFQLAVSNMLISTGHMFEHLEKGDSIRDPIVQKFDNVLANPPFGIKGLKYDEFRSSLKNEYTPIKSNSAVSLFIQAIIYMLKVNGKCAVVLPNGQELFSKSNKNLIKIREFLVKTCDLKEIIYLPSKCFENTSIKTCVFYFIKKKEGNDVLTTSIKISSTTQKETSREYVMTSKHTTKQVCFYEYGEDNEKHLLVEVPIEKIIENKYSLHYSEYIERVNTLINKSIEIKTLGEVCEFLQKSKRQASYGNSSGKYPFYTSSNRLTKFCDDNDYNNECLIIGTGGCANIKYSSKFSCSTDNLILKKGTYSNMELKYVFYHLLFNIEKLEEGFIGVGLKHVSKTFVEKIEIPIPSIEVQQEIIKYLDFICEKSIKTSMDKIEELKQLNEYCLNNQTKYGENEVKTLGEVCKIRSGNHSTKKSDFKNGSYPVIGGGKSPIDSHDQFNCLENTILCASHGSAGYISIYPIKTFITMAFALIEDKEQINKPYLFYYLKYIEPTLIALGKGPAQPCIGMDKLKSVSIPIPSLERQEQINKYCEYNDNLIKQLENEIENNKEQAKLFINDIMKA
uniref:site-specific DNA-methyltransferase (adenine-specific) n=1 Tax=Pyramimonas orientalis virus TaxID=455367 RepID=A0A7M3UNR7_POV01|nr:hypothetical protein HWQ62_00209 [Pyramimonas orientalis virus]